MKIPPMPGQMVDVGGYRLHVQSRGKGRPAAVLDSGLAGNSLLWANSLPEVARFGRVCAMDRAGYAWSDSAPSDLPRTSGQIVAEYRTLMLALGEEPPYVLVGHSFGGINMLVWAHRYPDEVTGLVLVDSSHPEMWVRVKEIPGPTTVSRGLRLFVMAGRVGLLRWIGPMVVGQLLGHGKNALPTADLVALNAFASQAKDYATALREAEAGEASFGQAKSAPGSLGSTPLMVLTADWWVRGKQSGLKQGSVALRQDMLTWSSRSREEIVEGCTHANLPVMRPDAVAKAVHWVIDQQ